MPPVSPERFDRLFRGLAPAERRAFVADLWAARGWETTVDGAVVVATRDGDEERIRVTDPGRFGTPTVADGDVLVSARDRDGVRDAADEAGVRYLAPEDIREMLLYAVDREEAAALFEETFGRSIAAVETPPTLRERVQGVAGVVNTVVRERADGSGGVVAVLFVLLLVGVAVAGPALGPASPAPTTLGTETFTPGEVGAVGAATESTEPTASPTPDGNESDLPPGLGEENVSDLSALVDSHSGRVRNDPRTLRVAASGPPSATYMQGAMAWNYTVRVEAPRLYRFDGMFRFPASQFSPQNESGVDIAEVNVFTRSDTKYRRQVDPTGTSYQRYATAATGDASDYTVDVRQYLRTYLDGQQSSVDCARLITSGKCLAYRVVVTGPPSELENASQYRAVAIVQDEGIVSSLRVRYTLPDVDDDGYPERVRFRIAYDFSPVDVTEPDWLPAAKNATEE